MIIANNTELQHALPNQIVVVEGEDNLFDKIKAGLTLCERHLTIELLGDDVYSLVIRNRNSTLWSMCATVISCWTLYLEIPALDLVLTPNGFGIVQNSNVVPASKERVERLRTAMIERRDHALSSLLQTLRCVDEWQNSSQQLNWARSLLQDIHLAQQWKDRKEYVGEWEALMAMRTAAEEPQQMLAEKYISNEVMERVCLHMSMDPDNSEGILNDTRLGSRLVGQLMKVLNGGKPDFKRLFLIVNYLRENDSDWQSSDVAELYAVPAFQNEKKSPGYFF